MKNRKKKQTNQSSQIHPSVYVPNRWRRRRFVLLNENAFLYIVTENIRRKIAIREKKTGSEGIQPLAKVKRRDITKDGLTSIALGEHLRKIPDFDEIVRIAGYFDIDVTELLLYFHCQQQEDPAKRANVVSIVLPDESILIVTHEQEKVLRPGVYLRMSDHMNDKDIKTAKQLSDKYKQYYYKHSKPRSFHRESSIGGDDDQFQNDLSIYEGINDSIKDLYATYSIGSPRDMRNITRDAIQDYHDSTGISIARLTSIHQRLQSTFLLPGIRKFQKFQK